MRTIKFRVWDTENKKWFPKDRNEQWVKLMPSGEIVWGDCDGYPEIGEGRFEVQQFTGLKTNSGMEIYEGDVNMDDKGRRSEVVFYAGGFYLKYSALEYKAIGSIAPFNYMVIGNIYENPELLKEAQHG